MWVRWTLPRLRIDQVMTTCLKYCTPIAAVMFVGATLWTFAFPNGLILAPSRPFSEVREGWLLATDSSKPAEPAKSADAKRASSGVAALGHVAPATH
jgi:NADH-quinone oxidoreductase subunit H